MARLNVDESSRRDPRITKLAKVTGELRFTAMGRLQEVWWLCYDRRSAVIPREDADLVAEFEGYSDHLVACRLAEVVDPEHIRVKGAEERIEYLLGQQEKGRKSAEARARLNHRSTTVQPALNSGSGVAQPTSSSSSSSGYSPAPDLGFQGEPPKASPSPAESPSPKAKKAQRAKRQEIPIPEDWTPNEAHRLKAQELGLNLTREAERFRDNAIAKGRTYCDWHAAFRTWLGNAVEFNRGRAPPGVGAPVLPFTRPPDFEKLT